MKRFFSRCSWPLASLLSSTSLVLTWFATVNASR